MVRWIGAIHVGQPPPLSGRVWWNVAVAIVQSQLMFACHLYLLQPPLYLSRRFKHQAQSRTHQHDGRKGQERVRLTHPEGEVHGRISGHRVHSTALPRAEDVKGSVRHFPNCAEWLLKLQQANSQTASILVQAEPR